MARRLTVDEHSREIARSLSASAEARDMVRHTRAVIAASRDAIRDSDAKIERARSRWKEGDTGVNLLGREVREPDA